MLGVPPALPKNIRRNPLDQRLPQTCSQHCPFPHSVSAAAALVELDGDEPGKCDRIMLHVI